MAQRCTSCGAAVEVPPEVLSTTCRFCDAPLVDDGEALEAPDAVVPFRVTGPQAGQALRRHLETRFWAPERLRRAARPEAVRGAFVPCFAWDAATRSRWSARVGVNWQRTETYTTTDGDGKTVTRTRTVTETEWFPTEGTHAARWVHHLVSASRGLTEAEANALEPFDLGHRLPWDPALVAGQVAEHPTRSVDEARAVAGQELVARARDAVGAFLPGDTHAGLEVHTEAAFDGVSLVLVPVWTAVVRDGDAVHRLLVNGQTGEVVGALPTSWVKVAGAVLVGLLLVAAVVGLVVAWGGA